MRKLLLFLLFISFFRGQNLQYAKFPLLYHYSVPENFGSPRQLSIVQDSLGNLFTGSENGGILFFDGKSWEKIPTKGIVTTFGRDAEGNIYVGMRNDFGRIVRTPRGEFKYISLNDKLRTYEKIEGDVFNILVVDGKVYFINRYKVYRYDPATDDLIYYSFGRIEINGLTYVEGSKKIYVNLSHKYGKDGKVERQRGLFELKTAEKYYKIPSGKFLGGSDIVFTFPVSKWKTLIATSDNKLWVTDFKNFVLLDENLQKKLKDVKIFGGEKISDRLMLLYTQYSGVYLIDFKARKLVSHFSTENGLLDNEIFSAYYDGDKGLWISHNFGLTYILINLPINNYGNIGGLSGVLTDFSEYKGKVYVSTSDGLFYLSKISVGSSLTKTYKKKVKVMEEQEMFNEEYYNRAFSPRGMRSFGRRRYVPPVQVIVSKEVTKEVKEKINYSRNRYYFKRIKLPSYALKCNQIVEREGNLYVATIGGIFKVQSGRAVPIIDNVYAKMVLFSKYNKDRLFVIQTEGRILSYVKKNGKWKKEALLYKLETDIVSVLEEGEGLLWLSGKGKSVRLRFYKSDFQRKPSVSPYNFNIDPNTKELIYVFSYNGKVYAHDDFRFYVWKEDMKSFVPVELINKLIDGEYIITHYISGKNLWIQTKENLYLFDLNKGERKYIRWGKVMSSPASKIKIYGKNLWGLFGNKLVSFNRKFLLTDTGLRFKAYIKKMKALDSLVVLFGEKPRLDYYLNSLEIELSAPFYISPEKVKYRYKIKGLFNKWQETNQGKLNLPSLREGDYELIFQAINILGQRSRSVRYSFSVSPPWYRTWWAYIFYALLVGLFIYFGVQLYALNLEKRNKELERKVEERTEELRLKNATLEQQKLKLERQKQRLKDALKRIEEQQQELIASEKMAAVGKSVGKAAHELNTPLGAILGIMEDVNSTMGDMIKMLQFLALKIPESFVMEFFKTIDAINGSEVEQPSTREERAFKRKVLAYFSEQGLPLLTNMEELAKVLARIKEKEPVLRSVVSFYKQVGEQKLFNIYIAFLVRLIRLRTNMYMVGSSARKMSKIVKDLKYYSRDPISADAKPELINLEKHIKEILEVYKNYFNRGIKLETHFEEGLEIYGFPDELGQVWTNILFNAIQALGAEGKITIRTYSGVRKGKGEVAVVEIEDNGPGIPEEIKDKIFEPFFTTKKGGEGTGLGLSIVRTLVEVHFGLIELESEPGRTLFRIILPKESKLSLMV